jgi:hypothetical protein
VFPPSKKAQTKASYHITYSMGAKRTWKFDPEQWCWKDEMPLAYLISYPKNAECCSIKKKRILET